MRLTQKFPIAIKGIALTMMVTLVGCVDLKQSIEIGDGVALAQLDAENLGTFCESNDDLQLEVSGSLKRTVKQLYEGEDLVCRMRIVGPIQEFGKQLTEIPKGDLNKMLNFRMVDETTLRIESVFESNEDMTASSAEEKAMIAAMMQGRVLSWSVKAPRIVQSPHKFTAIAKVTLPWYQPVLDLFS